VHSSFQLSTKTQSDVPSVADDDAAPVVKALEHYDASAEAQAGRGTYEDGQAEEILVDVARWTAYTFIRDDPAETPGILEESRRHVLSFDGFKLRIPTRQNHRNRFVFVTAAARHQDGSRMSFNHFDHFNRSPSTNHVRSFRWDNGTEAKTVTLEQQLREDFSKAIERIEKLEKEVLQLHNKIAPLESQLAPRNLAAAVQDQASRRPQRTR
jgi:hypothetical protein